jgi:hypothetical protein
LMASSAEYKFYLQTRDLVKQEITSIALTTLV